MKNKNTETIGSLIEKKSYQVKLNKAKIKYSENQKYVVSSNIDIPFEEFVIDCYLNHNPGSYGKYIHF